MISKPMYIGLGNSLAKRCSLTTSGHSHLLSENHNYYEIPEEDATGLPANTGT
jgi:hypothetical protein